jgi:hypothetical protein
MNKRLVTQGTDYCLLSAGTERIKDITDQFFKGLGKLVFLSCEHKETITKGLKK